MPVYFHLSHVLLLDLIAVLRDQPVFITWGGPEEFRGGSLEIGLPKGGGGVYSLEDFVEGGFKKYILYS